MYSMHWFGSHTKYEFQMAVLSRSQMMDVRLETCEESRTSYVQSCYGQRLPTAMRDSMNRYEVTFFPFHRYMFEGGTNFGFWNGKCINTTRQKHTFNFKNSLVF